MPLRNWRELFEGGNRPLIGMVHLQPLVGAPRYGGSLDAVTEAAAADVVALSQAGFDAVLFVNEGDSPYPDSVGPETVAAMAAVIATVAPSLQFGVEVLFDAQASLAVAAATKASFIRGSVLGASEGTSGIREGRADRLMRRRRELGAEHVGVFGTVVPELANPLSALEISGRARAAHLEHAVDALLVGGYPGQATAPGAVELVREAAPGLPVLANSGITLGTIGVAASLYDGFVIGSALKDGGALSNPVDLERASALVRVAKVPVS